MSAPALRFRKLLIANRGEIALRLLRTARRLGLATVAVYSEADQDAPHVRLADEAVLLGPGPARESYLNVPALLDAAQRTGAEAVHPGYGFLSENPGFARAVQAAGLIWVGPSPESMEQFGLKHSARALAAQAGVPLLDGSGLLAHPAEALEAAGRIGYPVMLKSTAGGGGIGMRLCASPEELSAAYDAVVHLGQAQFASGGVFLERFVARARHVEVQVFGDGQGRVLVLGDRDCSAQRRHQKVLEEGPAPGLSPALRADLHRSAQALAASAAYASAGTLEFIYDPDREQFAFLEVNTRLQVEHTVTEEIFGLDLVEWMLRLAGGDISMFDAPAPVCTGHAFQARVYAEDPGKNFQPSTGLLTQADFPAGVRVDGWVSAGTEITPFYDPLLAKVIVRGATRDEALSRLQAALAQVRLAGMETNLSYLRQIAGAPEFQQVRHFTRWLQTLAYERPRLEVLEPGTQTTVQDWPGRVGYWQVGVPPSGPMDSLHFRLANRLVGNPEGAAGLEATLVGPTLRFHARVRIALTGADLGPTLNGRPVPCHQALTVEAGDVLVFGPVKGRGQRVYLAVEGGLDVPEYLGSRSTFTLGRFGGHGGRALQTGDVLPLAAPRAAGGAPGTAPSPGTPGGSPGTAPYPATPPPLVLGDPAPLDRLWEAPVTLRVLYGPQGAPDFFQPQDIDTLFSAEWSVHFNSSRTGVRLVGPQPQWARPSGGEAGLHPSNIHDNAYVVGSLDFTGDMPVLLGPDGPSLGGFVCPATVIQADLWKLGQLNSGDKVRFSFVTCAEARQAQARQEAFLSRGEFSPEGETQRRRPQPPEPILLAELDPGQPRSVTLRRCGDAALLIEFGPMELDLALRFRAQLWFEALEKSAWPGLRELTPGIRSLQVQYDPGRMTEAELVQSLLALSESLPKEDEAELPSRTVWLPLSWDDPATRLAIERYLTSVRPGAPWGPSNIEFIRRINGLASLQEVYDIVFQAEYLVLGLGDVYLGAPVATPVDPRHRLVTTKYNPARTWTPENAVGIGGAYLCVYGMEGPGGYQFVGRTVPMWNRFHVTPDFAPGRPWLLRFFDRLRFYPVSAEELLKLRRDFLQGSFQLKTEEGQFRLGDYKRWLAANVPSIEAARQRQQQAFEAERQAWEASGQATFTAAEAAPAEGAEAQAPEGTVAVRSGLSGAVWKLAAPPGAPLALGDPVLILESMKMEVPVTAPQAGVLHSVLVKEGQIVQSGQVVAFVAV